MRASSRLNVSAMQFDGDAVGHFGPGHRDMICTFGLYSALRACSAMVFRSSRTSRFTVATMFLSKGVDELSVSKV
jgi:hypothetical protein